MRQLTLLLLAAFLFTSCDNLKTKDSSKSEEDTEETATKKKKKKAIDEEEENAEDEPTTTKKKRSSSDDELTDEESTNDDETSSDYVQGWTKAQQKKFFNQCAETASKQVGQERAQEYCNCMMKKIEKRYPNADDINQMTESEINKLAITCAQ